MVPRHHRGSDRAALRARYLPGNSWLVLLACALFVVGFAASLVFRIGGTAGVRSTDDLAECVAALAAGAACAVAARRTSAAMRRSWVLLGIATASWGIGEAIWSYYELIRHTDTPFPSLADVGFLIYPVAAAASLWVFPCVKGAAARGRWLLDAGIMVSSLIAISWATALGAAAHAGGDSAFAFAVSLAYPVGDILILTLALFALARARAHRLQLTMLSASMLAMATSDSAFTYLTATDSYGTGTLVDLGWVVSFLLLVVLAAVATHPARLRLVAAADPSDGRGAAATMLPYLPLLAAAVVMAYQRIVAAKIGDVEAAATAAAFVMVLVRQYSTVRQNRALLDTLAAREEQLRDQAFHDPLTGLANRALFMNRVQHALDRRRRELRGLAIVFCDLDDFKTVNDTFGHGAGDQLLIAVARRLSGSLRPGDTLARLGGDEFAVLLEDPSGPLATASRMVEVLRKEFTLAGTQVSVRASVGLTELAGAGPEVSTDDLLAQADIAMYSAKHAGKGRLASYRPSMVVPNADDLQLRQPLTEAIRNRAIGVVFQPIVRLDSGVLLGFEALARWRHQGRPVPPTSFVPIAIRAGLVAALTDHVLDEACHQLARWSQQAGHHRLRVGVNIPPSLVADPYFPDRVAAVMLRYQLRPNQLVLEITEEALVDDVESASLIGHQLQGLGVRLSLDDFGKGYSSLQHLHRIPLNSLKIDRSFVTDVDTDPNAERFAAALVSLGRDLGLDVIAEGIERATQATALRRAGCLLGQGYHFCRPSSAAEIDLSTFGELAPEALQPEAPVHQAPLHEGLALPG